MVRPCHNFVSVDEFISFLEEALGYLEKCNVSNLGDFTAQGKIVNAGSNNYTVYWDWYEELGYGNYQGQAYCACGVCTMLVSGFGLDKAKKLLCGGLYIYCPDGYNRFKSAGRIYSNPKKGDIVFFWSDSLGRWSHTGYVVGVDANEKGYTTWEANTSAGNDCVIRNGGATCKKHYTLGERKVAFGRPDYAACGIGLGKETPKDEVVAYDVSSDCYGIECTASTLNVRSRPGIGTIIGCIKKGEKVQPSKKCFINGVAWYYIGSKCGWCSASYFEGWIKEACGRWWYLLPGYNYYTDRIAVINNVPYYFDSTGYMFVGTITFTTDESGALKRSE